MATRTMTAFFLARGRTMMMLPSRVLVRAVIVVLFVQYSNHFRFRFRCRLCGCVPCKVVLVVVIVPVIAVVLALLDLPIMVLSGRCSVYADSTAPVH